MIESGTKSTTTSTDWRDATMNEVMTGAIQICLLLLLLLLA